MRRASSAAIAPFQSSATSAFLPAAKSGSSCAQSASDPIDPMVVQIGQSSGASFASRAALGRTEPRCNASFATAGLMAAYRPRCCDQRTEHCGQCDRADHRCSACVGRLAGTAPCSRRFICVRRRRYHLCQRECLGLPDFLPLGIGVLGQVHELAVVLGCLLAIARRIRGTGNSQERAVSGWGSA